MIKTIMEMLFQVKVRHPTSALVGDPDPYSWVITTSSGILGSMYYKYR